MLTWGHGSFPTGTTAAQQPCHDAELLLIRLYLDGGGAGAVSGGSTGFAAGIWEGLRAAAALPMRLDRGAAVAVAMCGDGCVPWEGVLLMYG